MLLGNKPAGTLAYLGGLPAVLEPFCWAWGQLIQYNTEYLTPPGSGQYVHLDKATVSLHDVARNSLVERMRGDWLLMLDTDHAPEPDLAVRLLYLANAIPADVLTAVYLHKTPPHSPVLYVFEDETFKPLGDWDREVTALEVDSAGAGALLVRRRVFDRIRDELREGPFDRRHPFGEDHSFFLRCRQLKIPAYAALGIESPHLRVTGLTLDRDYDRPPTPLADRRECRGVVLGADR